MFLGETKMEKILKHEMKTIFVCTFWCGVCVFAISDEVGISVEQLVATKYCR